MAEMERVPRGELVVAANEGTCLHILPEVFAEFKKLYPDVSVNVKRSESPKILEAIIENSIDFGVVSMPVNDKRLTTVVIHRDELVLITPPRHALSKQKTLTLEQIAKYPLLVPKIGRTRDMIESLFDERRLKPDYLDGVGLQRTDQALCGRQRRHSVHCRPRMLKATSGRDCCTQRDWPMRISRAIWRWCSARTRR